MSNWFSTQVYPLESLTSKKRFLNPFQPLFGWSTKWSFIYLQTEKKLQHVIYNSPLIFYQITKTSVILLFLFFLSTLPLNIALWDSTGWTSRAFNNGLQNYAVLIHPGDSFRMPSLIFLPKSYQNTLENHHHPLSFSHYETLLTQIMLTFSLLTLSPCRNPFQGITATDTNPSPHPRFVPSTCIFCDRSHPLCKISLRKTTSSVGHLSESRCGYYSEACCMCSKSPFRTEQRSEPWRVALIIPETFFRVPLFLEYRLFSSPQLVSATRFYVWGYNDKYTVDISEKHVASTLRNLYSPNWSRKCSKGFEDDRNGLQITLKEIYR